ncbi:unnamed protein product [Spirodela intermedia]|uniref:Uncharacterized protein n=1 Tax=Spirodela intermedia TaxID=51605 RepID=A0A7I8JLA0_SPIIN|nr:unnamed protein product [Spirodela intermedia]CAA6670262.1 unnamed protein product [Spirodela intermedia]
MSSFSITRKKTPFQKHKEEEEAKKKRDEEENARLYQEFVESFQGDNAPGSKAFVRGGTINPNDRHKPDSEGGNSKDGVSVPKKGSRYVPSFIPPPLSNKGRDPERKKEDEKPKEKDKGKPRNIDFFLEELKMEQERREKRHQDREQRRDGRHDSSAPISRFDELPDDFDPSGKFPGSFDDGDPQTTNLYVGNLSPQVDENFLLRTFGRFGPIASVKIMWPRTEEERRRQRNCGFVAFMNRVDGQAAKDEMQGVVVYGYELKIGWGKSVSLPSQALPALLQDTWPSEIRRFVGNTVVLSGPDAPPVTTVATQNSELVLTPNVPDIIVVPPEDDHLRHIIDTMALYVLDGGCTFEQAIMERGRGNSLFNFLFELASKEHTYYVWRLYSFAQGDTLQRWRTEPFIMITGSGRWMPPPLPAAHSPEHEKEAGTTYAAGRSRRVELERTLTDPQRDEFEDMLREAMGFALDNADAAGEIVEVLTESLTLKETPIPTKVSRLMLVSDILHNSSAPVKNASAYRTKFEGTLPDIMESFNDLYCSITGRITAEALKERVLKVLQVWSDWFLFSDAYVSGVTSFHSICGDAPEIISKVNTEEKAEGGKFDQDAALAVGKGAAMKELCRHNGLSLCGGREMMVARLLYLEDAEKQRVFDRDEGLKYGQNHLNKYSREDSGWSPNVSGRRGESLGEPMAKSSRNRRGEEGIQADGQGSSTQLASALGIPQPESRAFASKKEKSDPILVSKWAEDDASDDDDRKDSKDLGLGYSSSGSENADGIRGKNDEAEVASEGVVPHVDSIMTEEQRQKLRRLEVAVMEYRESLEEQGIRNTDEIERRVASHRRRLKSEYGLADSGEDARAASGLPSRKEVLLDRKQRYDAAPDSSRKRHRGESRSQSPAKKAARDRDRQRERERERAQEPEGEKRKEREKSGSRERDDHERARERDGDWRRRGK